jgi:hypothetical protein
MRIPPVSPTPVEPRKRVTHKPITWEPWLSLGIGAGLTALYQSVPLIDMVVGCLATVIHELGHTATAWLFCNPTVPAFDLKYGGGIARGLGRQPVLVAAAYAGFAYFTFQARGDWKKVILWLSFLSLYTLAMATVLHGILISFMGQGGELVFSGIFIYRALSGSQVLRREERPLYAFLGMAMLLGNTKLAWGLMTSADAREIYHEAHGGLTMDFDVIADEYLHWPLAKAAVLLLIACLVTPLAAFAAYGYARRSK